MSRIDYQQAYDIVMLLDGMFLPSPLYPDGARFEAYVNTYKDFYNSLIDLSEGVNDGFTSLNTAIENVITSFNQRITNLVSTPTQINTEIDGLRKHLKDFLDVLNVNDVDGLSEKFGLMQSRIDNKVEQIRADDSTGITISYINGDYTKPILIQNNPPNYYNKIEIDNLLLGIESNGSTALIDNLTTNDSSKALTANQGKILKDLLDSETISRTTANTNLQGQIALLDSNLDLQIAEIYTAIDSISINLNNLQTQINTINNTILNLDAIL